MSVGVVPLILRIVPGVAGVIVGLCGLAGALLPSERWQASFERRGVVMDPRQLRLRRVLGVVGFAIWFPVGVFFLTR